MQSLFNCSSALGQFRQGSCQVRYLTAGKSGIVISLTDKIYESYFSKTDEFRVL